MSQKTPQSVSAGATPPADAALRPNRTVFISYRRHNAPWALAIFQDLRQHGFDVFIDYRNLNAGDFRQFILENIRSRAHFLVILSPSSLERCKEEADIFRREIEEALVSRRNIVPLFLERFDFATPEILEQLPPSLARLQAYNGLSIPVEYFDAAMTKLRERFLELPVAASPSPNLSLTELLKFTTTEQSLASAASPIDYNLLGAFTWFERGYASRNPREAIAYYDEAVKMSAMNAEFFRHRGAALRRTGNLSGALADLDRAVHLDGKSPASFVSRGLVRHAAGDLPGALEDFEAALTLDPNCAKAYNNRGVVRHVCRDLEGAEQDYTRAIQLDPIYSDAFYNRGRLASDRGDTKKALGDYSEAIRLNPEHGAAYRNRAQIRRQVGDASGADQDRKNATRLRHAYEGAERSVFFRRETADIESVRQGQEPSIATNATVLASRLLRRRLIKPGDGDA